MKEALQKKINLKTKPLGSLGKLEDLALKIGTIQNTLAPELKEPTILVFAGDHGLVEEGVSPFPKEVTFQMVMNFLGGGAAINVFCRQNGLKLKVVDAGVDFDFSPELNLIHAKIAYGTKNILKEPAMSTETCQRAMEKGREIVREEHRSGCNILGFGEMGIGNTSAASLLMHKFTGHSIKECTGRGTGHDDKGLMKKIQILEAAAEKYQVSDPLEILATFGGLEIAMMCGAMLEAKELGMVILVDGFISTAGIMSAYELDNKVLDNAIFSHSSLETGHTMMLEYLKAEPVVHLNMRLGEGSGAAVAYPLVKASISFLNEMASFEDAGVSNKE